MSIKIANADMSNVRGVKKHPHLKFKVFIARIILYKLVGA